ncbi:MAG: hypothetical protein J6S85_26700 [Methanobrevibacter sp.]|nr:hypothetical protein [Methanobrevibacter sp.]MBO7717185.1 hypothetical protein [Methanobrevibacter sp.]
MWQGYNNYNHYFNISQLDDFFKEISSVDIPIMANRRKEVINVPATLDIETSSTYVGSAKFATMYLWGFGFNGSVIIGRTWKELFKLRDALVDYLELSDKRILYIFIHNLGYEFQWLRRRICWTKTNGEADIFAMKERRPIYARTRGFEFRCSYFLSNYALSYIGDELLKKYPVEKAVGDLDYSLVRHYLTPLSDKEIWYQVKDCQVVMSYIQEKIEQDGGIMNIPLTNTGYVRNYCRDWCFGENDDESTRRKTSAKYHEIMKSLTIKTGREYDQNHDAFGGGFVHAAARYSGKTLHNVWSKDEASAYPAAMVSDYFPMTRGIFIGDIPYSQLAMYLKFYCCLFTVTLHDVTPKFIYENYISLSHCHYISDDYVTNNGRIAAADCLSITVTELDWAIITKCYDFDESKVRINGLRIYQRDYLPRAMIMAILNLYHNKTSLKGVEGKETEYMVSKNMINASFGMAVTAIVRPEIIYTDEWGTEEINKIEQLVDYNNNYSRFLFYPWGVWVTAHARFNLWKAIFEAGEDYVYSDTDSCKLLNYEKHKKFFENYNTDMKIKLMKMCAHYNIPFEMCHPKTPKGEDKWIGVWEDDGEYKTFRTIGAKRYMYEDSKGKLSFTISGVNKKYGVPFLLSTYTKLTSDEWKEKFRIAYNPTNDEKELSKQYMQEIIDLHNSGKLSYKKIFDSFTEGLYFPPGATGKQTITYIDNPTCATIVDYLGNPANCMEFSSVHMEPQDYSLSRSADYLKFLQGFSDATI